MSHSVSQPFDPVAAEYDRDFTATPLGRMLREAVWAYLREVFQPGMHILELNCGTGEDACWLAQQGMRVTATDRSAGMLAVAQAKVRAAGLAEAVGFEVLALEAPPAPRQGLAGQGQYDGVLSNFGGLNCVADWQPLAQYLGAAVRPGGRVVLVVMGPWCPWEVGWHLLHGQPRTATRRWRGGVTAHLGRGDTVRVWYPSPGRLAEAFAPWFTPVATVGVGVLLPPSYLGHLVTRWPGLFGGLASLEQRVARRFPATLLNDHYLLDLERKP